MTNNPTIDGVSRELLEQVTRPIRKPRDETVRRRAVSELRALLDAQAHEHEWDINAEGTATVCYCGARSSDAPAVERQEPYGFASVLIDNFRFAIDNGKQPTFSRGDLLWLIEQLSKAQSESAALQSTIAQLEDKLNKAIDLDFKRSETIEQLQARVQELESGMGEPIGYVDQPYAKWLENKTSRWTTIWATDGADNPARGKPSVALFTATPAPVAVVHPFAEKVIRKLQRVQECAEDGQDTDIGRHWLDLLTQLGLLNRLQRSPARWEITQQGEDCLDATTALNGERK